jgi:hypothetical protein
LEHATFSRGSTGVHAGRFPCATGGVASYLHPRWFGVFRFLLFCSLLVETAKVAGGRMPSVRSALPLSVRPFRRKLPVEQIGTPSAHAHPTGFEPVSSAAGDFAQLPGRWRASEVASTLWFSGSATCRLIRHRLGSAPLNQGRGESPPAHKAGLPGLCPSR